MALELFSDPRYIYLGLAIGFIYLLFTYKKEFSPEAIVDFIVYLVNKIVLFFVSLTFLFAFMFSILDPTNEKILTFIQNMFKGLIYYIFLNYGVLYLLKFFNWVVEFFKTHDLLNMKYFEKLRNKSKGGKSE